MLPRETGDKESCDTNLQKTKSNVNDGKHWLI